jgi:hypothetical protein
LGRLHLSGHSPRWSALYPRAGVVSLPTYPFEHRRYWLTPAAAGDAAGLGLAAVQHPLLGAVTELADQDQFMVSGRLWLGTQGWLGGHAVGQAVLFPGPGFLEIVLHAGQLGGCPVIDELVLHTPLLLSGHSATAVQITLAPLVEGRRVSCARAQRGGRAGYGWGVACQRDGELGCPQPRVWRLMRRGGLRPSMRMVSIRCWLVGAFTMVARFVRCAASVAIPGIPIRSALRWCCPCDQIFGIAHLVDTGQLTSGQFVMLLGRRIRLAAHLHTAPSGLASSRGFGEQLN